MRLTAELNRLEYMEESVRQLTDVERTRAVSMAQQETVSLAQILKVSVWISFSLSVILLVIRDGDCFTFAYRAIFNLLMSRRALFVCLFVCLSLFLVSYQEMLYHPQVSQLSYNVVMYNLLRSVIGS